MESRLSARGTVVKKMTTAATRQTLRLRNLGWLSVPCPPTHPQGDTRLNICWWRVREKELGIASNRVFMKSSRSSSGQKRLVPSSRLVPRSRLAHRRHGTADLGSNEPSDRQPSQLMKWSSSSSRSSSSRLHELQVITYLQTRVWTAVLLTLRQLDVQ